MEGKTAELAAKLSHVRAAMAAQGLGAVRLRGVDWFAWATCGGSSVVLLTAEAGVAEVLITATGAWVLTDVIERDRLESEELPRELRVWAGPWQAPHEREDFVAGQVAGAPVASDRPTGNERPLPEELADVRASLMPDERERYRTLGREAAQAMTEVLTAARSEWTGLQLAGAASEALWSRGIEPTLTLVGGERRLPLHRHATASRERLGARAMLVFCARRHGLYANLTRFVYFRPPTGDERKLLADVAKVEAAVFAASRPGAALNDVYARLVGAYAEAGHPGAELKHHQGGTCGYLSRDVMARPDTRTRIHEGTAVAWNPSLPGAKLEDTAIVTDGGLELITVDPRWPTLQVEGRARPDVLVR